MTGLPDQYVLRSVATGAYRVAGVAVAAEPRLARKFSTAADAVAWAVEHLPSRLADVEVVRVRHDAGEVRGVVGRCDDLATNREPPPGARARTRTLLARIFNPR